MNRKTCPSRDLLLAYETAELPESSLQPLIAHISDCPACQADLETICAIDDTLIARLREPPAIHPYEAEPECRQAVLRLQQLAVQTCRGRDLSNARAIEPTIIGQLGEYELLEKLGEGGMGVVYKARHITLKRFVALKVLPKARVHRAGIVARFAREIEAIGRVNHANIVQAHDAREIDGEWFLVMEYVGGLDLEDLVRRHGPLPIQDACELIRQAAVGLQHANEHGLIHRDIKPSNLMLSHEGQVKILDLGLALLKVDQLAGSDTDAAQATGTELTASQQILGTASYMAPEQASDSHHVDARADIYSLGCTLYKLLTGRPPFAGADCRTPLDQILAHRSRAVEPIKTLRSEVPTELAAVIERMLAKNPAERFATPGGVADALKPWAADSDLISLLKGVPAEQKAELVRPTARGISPPSRFRRIALAVGGTAASIVLGIVILVSTGKGTVKLEFADAEAARRCTISIDGEAIRLENLGEPIRLWPGQHTLRVMHGDLEVVTREFDLLRWGKRVLQVSIPLPPDKIVSARTDAARNYMRALEIGNMAHRLAQDGYYDRARMLFSEVIELVPNADGSRMWRAMLDLSNGQFDAYHKDCEEMLRHFGPQQNIGHFACYRVCYACVLVPDAVSDWSIALELADRAVKANPKSSKYLHVRGAVLYRAGRWEEALETLHESRLRRNALNLDPRSTLDDAETCAFLAMAYHRLGQRREARKWFNAMAEQADLATFEEHSNETFRWDLVLPIRLLRGEVAQLPGISEDSTTAGEQPRTSN